MLRHTEECSGKVKLSPIKRRAERASKVVPLGYPRITIFFSAYVDSDGFPYDIASIDSILTYPYVDVSLSPTLDEWARAKVDDNWYRMNPA